MPWHAAGVPDITCATLHCSCWHPEFSPLQTMMLPVAAVTHRKLNRLHSLWSQRVIEALPSGCLPRQGNRRMHSSQVLAGAQAHIHPQPWGMHPAAWGYCSHPLTAAPTLHPRLDTACSVQHNSPSFLLSSLLLLPLRHTPRGHHLCPLRRIRLY